MKNPTLCLDTTERIRLASLSDDQFLLGVENQNIVLSYDALYDLTLRLTMLMQYADAQDESIPDHLLN